MKTLLVDIGSTLLERTVPGPFTRVAATLSGHGVELSAYAERMRLARCLLSGHARDAAADAAAEEFALTPAAAAAVRRSLDVPEGDPIILPGAVELVRSAVGAGWRIVAATNAAAWSEPLPEPLHESISATLSSADLGVLKQDAEFWRKARTEQGIDERTALVVGDNPVADQETPEAAGFCAVVHGPGRPTLQEIAAWLRQAAAEPEEPLALVAGRPVRWAGQHVLAVPHRHDLVASVTRRRVCAHLGRRPVTTTIVRRRDLAPALILPGPVPDGGLVWTSPIGERRIPHIPEDLRQVLIERGLSIDGLNGLETRHLISMVREARDRDVRRQRIENIVEFLLKSRETVENGA